MIFEYKKELKNGTIFYGIVKIDIDFYLENYLFFNNKQRINKYA